ncbi:MAG: hypothetical protein HQ592_04000 [Planctomycetes bacterium]|jgi:hypothetical protein|nr:hypothetical protein [Planctomycetota bacterium]
MPLPEIIHIDRGGSFSRTVTQDGSAMDLSAATKIELEFYDTPGAPIIAFDTDADPGNFDNDLSNGSVKFVWTAATFDSVDTTLVESGRTRQQHFARIVVYTATHTDGYMVPDQFVAEFWR